MNKNKYNKKIILIITFAFSVNCLLHANDNTVIPSKYDLRDVNGKCHLSPVKIQGGIFEEDGQFDVSKSIGICWAFAACAAFESNLLKQEIVNDPDSDFANISEWHMGNSTAYNQHIYEFDKNLSPDGIYWGYVRPVYGKTKSKYPVNFITWGTDPRAAIDYFSTGKGPVLEKHAPFPLDQVQNCEIVTPPLKFLPTIYSLKDANIYYSTDYNDYEEYSNVIKLAIMRHGALQTGVHTEPGDYPHLKGQSYIDKNNTMCTNEQGKAFNHSLSVVGWDDNREVPAAKNKGAWLVKDHGGENFYEKGFYWISYEDAVFLKKPIIAVAYIASKKNNKPEQIYQTHNGALSQTSFNEGLKSFDFLCDPKRDDSSSTAAVFTAKDNIRINSIGIVTVNRNEKLTVSIYNGWNYKKQKPGKLIYRSKSLIEIPECGYHVIDLNKQVSIKKGSRFAVSVEFQNNKKHQNDSAVYVLDTEQPVSEGKSFKLKNSKWEDFSKHEFMIDNDNFKGAIFYIQVFTEKVK